MSRKQLEDGRGAAGGCNDKIGNDREVTKTRQRGVRIGKRPEEPNLYFPSTKPLFAAHEAGLMTHGACTQYQNNTFSVSERIMQKRYD